MEILSKLLERFNLVFFSSESWSSGQLWLAMAIMIVWLMCACWAASLAEASQLSPKTNFFLGLLIPFVYPLRFVFTASPTKKYEAEQKAEAMRKAMEQQVVEAPVAVPTGPGEVVFNKEYFSQYLAYEGDEIRKVILTVDGSEVKLERVVECQPNVLIAEMKDENKNTKRIRIPYDRIEQSQDI